MKLVKMDDVRIPNGRNCKKCNAIFNVNGLEGNYGDYHCFIFKKRLAGIEYAISGTRDPWGHNKCGWAVRKCKECLASYPDVKENVVVERSGDGE